MFSTTTENKNIINSLFAHVKVVALTAVLAVALYALPSAIPGAGEANAFCTLATATADTQGVTCTAGAGGFDSSVYDDQDIDVRADGEASDGGDAITLCR